MAAIAPFTDCTGCSRAETAVEKQGPHPSKDEVLAIAFVLYYSGNIKFADDWNQERISPFPPNVFRRFQEGILSVHFV